MVRVFHSHGWSGIGQISTLAWGLTTERKVVRCPVYNNGAGRPDGGLSKLYTVLNNPRLCNTTPIISGAEVPSQCSFRTQWLPKVDYFPTKPSHWVKDNYWSMICHFCVISWHIFVKLVSSGPGFVQIKSNPMPRIRFSICLSLPKTPRYTCMHASYNAVHWKSAAGIKPELRLCRAP